MRVLSSMIQKAALAVLAAVAVSGTAVDAMAQQRVASSTIATLPGKCIARLNDADIGCPKGALHSALQNGRHLVNFATEYVASIAFVGARLETSDTTSVLWLDGVQINQQRYNADGQCTMERPAAGGVKLDCRAILHDGRRLSASLQAPDLPETFLGQKSAVAEADYCRRTIGLHGMLSRAQFQCGFGKYSATLTTEANRCMGVIGQDTARSLLREGMGEFDQDEKRRGRTDACNAALRDHPEVVQR